MTYNNSQYSITHTNSVIPAIMHIYIITILYYVPSVFTCIVGVAIQMTVYITLHYSNLFHWVTLSFAKTKFLTLFLNQNLV